MRIRSYLAILVLVSLMGGNGVRYLLSERFDSVSEQAQAHVDSLLWQKDFQRISADINQYLISADLVIASGETYLANGALSKGQLIASELAALVTHSGLLSGAEQLTASSADIISINEVIQRIATEGVSDSHSNLNVLLEEYDRIALALSDRIERLALSANSVIEKNSVTVESAQASMESHSFTIQLVFSLLVLFSWYWASRTISEPLQRLHRASSASRMGAAFDGVDFGPVEIKQLSNNFSQLTRSLSFQATHDPLTKLYNRRAFARAMRDFISVAQQENIPHALCYIDLDHFKAINDTCGHAVGDEILVNVAQIFTDNVRSSDVVARLGGDEFAILLHQCQVVEAQRIANKIHDAVRNFKYNWNDQVFRIGASIGITEINAKSGVVEDMLNAADIACMQAKKSGRDTVRTFDSCVDLLNQKRQEAVSVNQIRSALQEDRFELYCQDIIPLQNAPEQGKHYEILLRMRDENGKQISPAGFMPLVERYRLGTQIDQWVINATIDWLTKNPQELASLSMCSINLSGQSVGCADMRVFIANKLADSQFPSHKLCFEVTETAAITDLDCANELIAELSQYNCRFALDDFGSGLSSFAYLKNLTVDYVKIDGAFVKDMLKCTSDMATVKAINDVAKANGKQTIAEFVEDEEIAEALQALGVNFGQGYYFDKPSPLVAAPYVVYNKVDEA